MAERLQAGDATRWILREHSLEQIACVLRGALTGFRQARLDERLGAHFGRGCIDDVDRGAPETKDTAGLIKNLAIRGYTNSEYYLVNIAKYTIAPGFYHGCVPVPN